LPAAPEQPNAAHAATNQQQPLRQQTNKHPCGNDSKNVLVAPIQLKKRLRQQHKYSPTGTASHKENACGNESTNENTCGDDATQPDAASKQRNHLV
jgi:hypothetical protein